ncbi:MULTISPECIES: fumarylacetoacetate hydrolase family protein [Alphaproteobacteria]|uniref:Fumarylacetoacetate hydrolase n=2 Tax=Sphingomonadaceae TaxID=41297 RepID=A0A2A4FV34_9SPHN|nr:MULTISPECIES: fumarylacetoacetate hydrolase family protein [Alphaproteobacteria]ATE66118.1 fumarylacetoacetate hydrolase [Rhizorhabdus dicambivorans]PCE42042.1 fumarylacetoacetate hydrolase [Rhizorhabdus dicambivorans]CAA12268.1 ORF 2 [Sphingomonas sp. RW5]
MTMVFDPSAPTLAQVSDGRIFPVRRIFCVGRNYAEHAREMGRDPDREPPFFFTKWAETIVPSDVEVAYPSATANFHYEAELVVAIGLEGRDIPVETALDHVFGYATGLDMTRRDLQLKARAEGRPWDTGKNVEQSSPLGLLHPVAECGHLSTGAISLTVNGEVKQSADLADLIWPVADIIAFLSGLYRLLPGDLIYTGTPAGVGPVVPGDEIDVRIDGLTPTRIRIAEPAR